MCIYLHHCLLGFFEFKTMFLQAFLPKQSQKQSQCIAQTGSKSSPGTKPSLPLRFGKMWNLANSLQNSRRTALTPVMPCYTIVIPVVPNRIWQCPCLQPAPSTQHTSPSILETIAAGSARGAHGLWSDPAEVGEKYFPRSSQYLWRTRRT